MKKFNYITIILICFTFLFTLPLLAQDEVLIENIEESASNISADNIFIHTANKEINASGNVRFTNQQLSIKADRLVFRYNEQLITAFGDPIQLVYGDRVLEGKSLTLDYEKEVANISNAEIDIDKFNFKGDNIEYLQGKNPNIVLDDAYYTTCVMDEPHYHYTANSIEYYPNDRIVGKGIGLWWGETRLVTLPRYVVNVETDEEGNPVVRNTFPVPQLGYNGESGFFIELIYPYEINPNNYGRVHYLRENKNNISLDVNHKYRIDNNKLIFADYNEQKYTDDDDVLHEEKYMQLGFDHTVNQNVNYRVYLKEYEQLLPLSEAVKKTLFNLNLNYTQDKYSINTEVGYDFRSDIRNETISSEYSNKNLSTKTYNEFENEKVDKQKYIIRQTFDKYDWELKYLSGYDTDYLPYGRIKYYLNQDLDFSAGYGLVEEGEFKQHKIDYGLDYNKNFKINDNFVLDFIEKIKHVNYLQENTWLTNYETGIYLNMSRKIIDVLSFNQRIGYRTKYREGQPLFDIDDIDPDRVIVSNSELDLYYPKDKEHWKLNFDLEYSIPDEEFDTQKIGITHEYDCYSYQINYNFINQSIGFEFSFIN